MSQFSQILSGLVALPCLAQPDSIAAVGFPRPFARIRQQHGDRGGAATKADNQKPWKYKLIPEDAVKRTNDFKFTVAQAMKVA